MLNSPYVPIAAVEPLYVSHPVQHLPPPSLSHSVPQTPALNVVDSSLPAADVSNLFARFGAGNGAVRYREIHSDADAAAAAARWPLLAEWLAARAPTEPRR